MTFQIVRVRNRFELVMKKDNKKGTVQEKIYGHEKIQKVYKFLNEKGVTI